MAIQKSANMRGLAGSIGGVTYRMVNGQQVVSEKSAGSKALPSESQSANRALASLYFTIAAAISSVLAIGYRVRKKTRTPCNQFTAVNAETFRQYVDETYSVSRFLELKISKRDFENPFQFVGVVIDSIASGFAHLIATYKILTPLSQNPYKKLIAVVYNNETKQVVGLLNEDIKAVGVNQEYEIDFDVVGIEDGTTLAIIYFVYDTVTLEVSNTVGYSQIVTP